MTIVILIILIINVCINVILIILLMCVCINIIIINVYY